MNVGAHSLSQPRSIEPDDALASLDEALCDRPDHVYILVKKAHLLHQMGRRDEALSTAHRAVALTPPEATAFNMRGMIFDSLGRYDEARGDFERALELQPELADAINNIGILHSRAGDFVAALACYERSLALTPDQPQTRYNRAMALLVLGDWQRGFAAFECRFTLFLHEAVRLKRLAPIWVGQHSIAGKTVLLHHEQGYGDTLQFCRYVTLVEGLGARVILAVPKALRALMSSLPGRPRIVTEGEPIPAHDHCCSLMSLPLVFGTTPADVPVRIPYLRAQERLVQTWAGKLGARSRLRIGLVWSGRRYPPINYPRDMTLESLLPLLGIEGDFVSLQTHLTDTEAAILDGLPNVVRHGEHLQDFAETAALIENLDLVITVDTAVAHLAGALGKPTWLMNRYASCWRWLLGRADSPWYPTMRLFRQPSLGDWSSVVREVCAAARELLAVRRSPVASNPVAILNEALDEHRRGRLEEAVRGYRRVLASNPIQPESLHFLGVALAQRGEFEEATACLSLVVREQPHNAAAFNHRGNALAGLLRYEEAIASYDRAIGIDSTLADAYYNRGVALAELGRYEPAVASYERALQLNPDYSQAHNNLGNTLCRFDFHSRALSCYERAIECCPTFVDAWVNHANLLRRLHRYEDALRSSLRAIDCMPECAEAYNARGAVLACMGRYDEASSDYRRALELKPTLAEASWNQAIVALSRGQFLEGWKHYETRWKVRSLGLAHRFARQPPWLGVQSVRGRVVLLHAEQGYGDTLQFCRYAPLVAAKGARVVLSVPRSLQTLMGSLDGIERVIAQGDPPAFDFHCPLLSLPLASGTELASIPAPASYLRADAAASASWAERLGPRNRLRVGFSWSGSVTHPNDANRSISLEKLLPLTACDVQSVSLQEEVRAADEPALRQSPHLLRLGEELSDFAQAAALLSQLDLVVTVDTAIAHLAGALGKRVWILLPHVADWRWLQGRADSPWYPSARLFRQPVARDWKSVIEQVRCELVALIASQASPYFAR